MKALLRTSFGAMMCLWHRFAGRFAGAVDGKIRALHNTYNTTQTSYDYDPLMGVRLLRLRVGEMFAGD